MERHDSASMSSTSSRPPLVNVKEGLYAIKPSIYYPVGTFEPKIIRAHIMFEMVNKSMVRGCVVCVIQAPIGCWGAKHVESRMKNKNPILIVFTLRHTTTDGTEHFCTQRLHPDQQ